MKKYFIITMLTLMFTSCIQGNFKGLYGYYSDAVSQKPKLFLRTTNLDTICNKKNNNDDKIIVTNGISLKKCLNNYDKTIIYVWGPNCHSDICVPLQIIQKKCNENGYNLIVVAEYYDLEKMDYHYDIENNILGVDVLFYKTNLTKKYLDLFFKEIDSQITYSKIPDKFLEFSNDKFMSSFESINKIPNEN